MIQSFLNAWVSPKEGAIVPSADTILPCRLPHNVTFLEECPSASIRLPRTPSLSPFPSTSFSLIKWRQELVTLTQPLRARFHGHLSEGSLSMRTRCGAMTAAISLVLDFIACARDDLLPLTPVGLQICTRKSYRNTPRNRDNPHPHAIKIFYYLSLIITYH